MTLLGFRITMSERRTRIKRKKLKEKKKSKMPLICHHSKVFYAMISCHCVNKFTTFSFPGYNSI